MRLVTMRWIDRNIGSPACFLFTAHRKIMEFLGRGKKTQARSRRIAFIKLTEQGSTVLAAPAFKKAASLAGRDNLFLFVFPKSRPIFDLLEVVPSSNIIEIDPSTPGSFLGSFFRGVARARREGIDTVIDMEFFARVGAVLAYLTGASKRVGLHTFTLEGPYRGDLFTHRLAYNPYLHMSWFFLSLVEAAGMAARGRYTPIPVPLPGDNPALPVFRASEEEKTSALAKVESIKGSPAGRPLVIFNPKTDDLLPVRKWPRENYVALGRMINKAYPGATIVLTGIAREREKTGIIAGELDNAVNMAGETCLRELLALYCASDVLVSSDSGPALFAAMTPVRTIVLFGPETPALFGVKDGKTEAIKAGLACSPCVSVYNHRDSRCRSGECMKSITPEEVFRRVRAMLK